MTCWRAFVWQPQPRTRAWWCASAPDNPLIWGEAVDRLLAHYEHAGCDYAYNHIPRNNRWPDGLGAEVLSRELLEELDARSETACTAGALPELHLGQCRRLPHFHF